MTENLMVRTSSKKRKENIATWVMKNPIMQVKFSTYYLDSRSKLGSMWKLVVG